ncbi:hypothetical protein FNJ88_13500 [Chryseobacterium sp. SNU WT5]|uniref:hypothetical protein n=1 Tax=Chryseobacterium sp. SNU WT5 TaxID=2594269 RepID=UPI001180B4ED|nr:hypothetical protein [Chryseobacterium sp. SNU WT5]QDP86518.1 hypothetical protein FNJ88_13500 [Chryseobacterium sp. SNU WT5]
MKEYLLKRERIFHFLSLALIAGSLFLKDPIQKMTILGLGIVGLLLLSILKKQKALTVIYLALLLLSGLGYYLITTGKLQF